MDEMIERVERAIHAALTNTDFDASHMKDNQLAAAARAAIGAMREDKTSCGVCGCTIYPKMEKALSD